MPWTLINWHMAGLQGSAAEWLSRQDACVDPYWLLAEALDFRSFEPRYKDASTKVPVVLELCQPGSSEPRFVVAEFPRRDLYKLVLDGASDSPSVSRFQLGAPRTSGTLRLPSVTATTPLAGHVGDVPKKRKRIYRAVVDDGLPVAHQALLTQDRGKTTSRVRWLWDQGGTSASDPSGTGWKAGPGELGCQIDGRHIDEIIRASTQDWGVDEIRAYRSLGQARHLSRRTHGAGVLHMMAEDAPKSHALLCVQFPAAAVDNTAGGWLGYHALAALHGLIAKVVSDAKGAPWHLVVNLSYGGTAGPHDGTSMLELAMDELCTTYSQDDAKLDIVVAAGNARGWGLHASRTIPSGGRNDFTVFCSPDNPLESAIEVWLPSLDNDNGLLNPSSVSIEISAPGMTPHLVPAGEAHSLSRDLREPQLTMCAGAVFAHRVAQGTNGTMLLLLIRPTRTGAPDRAPSGHWTITVRNKAKGAIEVHAWIERNDLQGSLRRAPQTRFVADPEHAEHVNDDRCLSNAAGGAKTKVVGAIQEREQAMAPYSSIDARRPSVPEYFAAADESASRRGIVVPGFLSGSHLRMSGTSIAAPQVAAWLADFKPNDRVKPGPTNPCRARGVSIPQDPEQPPNSSAPRTTPVATPKIIERRRRRQKT